jgi:hypothetical protein
MRRRKEEKETDGDLQKVDEHDTRLAGSTFRKRAARNQLGRER